MQHKVVLFDHLLRTCLSGWPPCLPHGHHSPSKILPKNRHLTAICLSVSLLENFTQLYQREMPVALLKVLHHDVFMGHYHNVAPCGGVFLHQGGVAIADWLLMCVSLKPSLLRNTFKIPCKQQATCHAC